MGHAAFGLADEYQYYVGCGSDTDRDRHPGPEPTQPNVTVNTDRATLKWRHLLEPATTVPTMRNPDCTKCDTRASTVPASTVGLFEGAHYYHCDAYRSEHDCLMRTVGSNLPFCKVCQEAIRKKVIDGSKADCFVATAVYGDAAHPDVAWLREWRDRHLRGGPGRIPMRAVVGAYARLGPPAARHVAVRPALARALRQRVFAPAVAAARRRRGGADARHR